MTDQLAAQANLDFCYLTTTGRVTGKLHTIEIWFVLDGRTVYMLAGSRERADWVRNLRANPAVNVRIAEHDYSGTGRDIRDTAEDQRARELVVEKYQPRSSDDLSEWQRTALPIAIDLE